MTAALIPEARAQGWVVCFGASQPVEGDRVACPLRDATVPVARCLDCHYLAAMADERRPDRDCRIQDRNR
jgi:hypothetical protein